MTEVKYVARMFTSALMGANIPIIPIASATDLLSYVDSLRRQMSSKETAAKEADTKKKSRDVVAHSVDGQPLSESQVNIVTDIFSGLQSLSNDAFTPTGQQVLHDYLGQQDASRVIKFFTQGPVLSDC